MKMASPGQQYISRHYDYGYNGKTGYSRLLKEAHRTLVNKIKMEQDAAGAIKLQKFLQNIKDTARILNESTKDFKGTQDLDVAKRIGKMTNMEYDWYVDLINDIVKRQTNIRKRKGLSELKGYSLLRRIYGTQTDAQLFDDIAEEDLGIIFTKVKEKVSNKTYHVNHIASGTSSAQIAGAEDFTKIGDDLYNHFVEEFEEIAKQANQKYTLGDHIVKTTSGKVDLNLGTLTLTNDTEIKNEFLNELIPLLNEATFTVKNYKGSTFEKFGLELGHSNLFRSIVAELNIVFPQNHTNWQRDIFYRGAQIITKTNKEPSASRNEVMKHFSHMRFIYELSGLGLIDSKTGKPQFAKYLIYNDPISSNIYVQDTASIILDEINKRHGIINVFGTIRLKNIKGYKK